MYNIRWINEKKNMFMKAFYIFIGVVGVRIKNYYVVVSSPIRMRNTGVWASHERI
jgi:hypothetical protein